MRRWVYILHGSIYDEDMNVVMRFIDILNSRSVLLDAW